LLILTVDAEPASLGRKRLRRVANQFSETTFTKPWVNDNRQYGQIARATEFPGRYRTLQPSYRTNLLGVPTLDADALVFLLGLA
jgi:hypothetical protein